MKLKQLCMILAPMLVAACGDGSGIDQRAGNTAPTISAIGAQAIGANSVSPIIGFTVSDERPDDLVVTAMSDNPLVVPDAGLAIGGSGSNRSITMTPVLDSVGDAFITIVVTDPEGLSASVSFLLNVDPQQESMQLFTRDLFVEDADDDPELINAVEFDQDADNDDFADLLAL